MTEDQKNTFSNTSLPREIWEKRLAEKEHTAVTPRREDTVKKVALKEEPKPSKKTSFNFWAGMLLALFLISTICGLMLTTRSFQKSAPSKEDSLGEALPSMLMGSSDKTGVAWIKVYGVISQDNNNNPFSRPTGASAIAKRIREAGEDKNVKAIVLDINSPGGTVASVQNIYSEILKAKKNKKVVALFRDVAASGGFYVAMAADKIVAEPGTITGSVGVIMQTSNLEGLFEKIGVKMEPITSGKYKDIGSAYRPMTQEEKDLLQDMVNDTYTQFFEAVKAGRPQVDERVLREYTDGRIFTGQRAFSLGFIDKLGGEYDALQLAGELAGIEDPKIIGNRSNDFKDFIFSFGASMDKRNMINQLQNLATPSVSYLWVQ